MPLAEDMKKAVVLIPLGTLLTLLLSGIGAWGGGYIQAARGAKEFFPAGLAKLTAQLESRAKHDAEIEQVIQNSKTLNGSAEVTQAEMAGVMVPSRSRFKNGDMVEIENMDSADHQATDAKVIGSFSSQGDLVLRVPPSIARILGFSEGRIRVEVRPK